MERPIKARTTIGVAFARARDVLVSDPGTAFTGRYTTGERRAGRFHMDLSVPLGAGTTVHQEVTVQLGVPRSIETGYVQPLAWHPNGRERLLPAFDGALELSEVREGTALRLTGRYTVPLGVVGRLADGVLGHQLARRSIETLLESLGRRLDVAVERRLEIADGLQYPQHLTTVGQKRSEIYIG